MATVTLVIIIAVIIGHLVAARLFPHAGERKLVREERPTEVKRPLTGNPILDYIHERYPDAV